jgi:hypothetical protein
MRTGRSSVSARIGKIPIAIADMMRSKMISLSFIYLPSAAATALEFDSQGSQFNSRKNVMRWKRGEANESEFCKEYGLSFTRYLAHYNRDNASIVYRQPNHSCFDGYTGVFRRSLYPGR